MSSRFNAYRAEAWYKPGITIFTAVRGYLEADDSGLRFLGDDGSALDLPYGDILKVRLDPAEFLFVTSKRSYLIRLFPFDRKAAPATKEMEDSAVAFERVLRDHAIPTYGMRTNAGRGR